MSEWTFRINAVLEAECRELLMDGVWGRIGQTSGGFYGPAGSPALIVTEPPACLAALDRRIAVLREQARPALYRAVVNLRGAIEAETRFSSAQPDQP